jgi:elongation factor P
MDIAEVKKNVKILIDGIPYDIIDAEFVKPGKGRAIYRLRLKNLNDGGTLDRTFHSGDKVDEIHIEALQMQYLYPEGDDLIFMETDNFEQHHVPASLLGDKKLFLKDGVVCTVAMYGDRVLEVQMPMFVELAVKQGAITSRTDTITAQMKTAVLEGGASVQVPTFVKEGDIIKVDTRTGTYVERVGAKK